MKSKKLLAVTLAATMVVGSSMTAFAEDADSATGTGGAFNHVDKDITSVTLPTTADVANVFNYYVDPERAIQDAGTLADGQTAVTPNTDGVYFAHPGAAAVPDKNATVTAFSIGGKTAATDTDIDGTPDIAVTIPTNYTGTTLTYDAANGYWVDGSNAEVQGVSFVDSDTTASQVTAPNASDTITVDPFVAGTPAGSATYLSTSEEVEFEGKNSVDVDISVAATVTASQGGKDIALVEDQDALDDATTPALLMTLHVGSKSAAITSDGATVKETIVGKPNNFAVTTANNKFVYGIRTNTDPANGGTALDAWGSADVKLAGKTNNKTIEEGMTAPTIALTWTIAKHNDSALSKTTISSTANTITVTGATVTGVTLVKANGTTAACTAGTNYTFANGTLTVQAGMLSNNVGGKLRIALSTGTSEEVTIQ